MTSYLNSVIYSSHNDFQVIIEIIIFHFCKYKSSTISKISGRKILLKNYNDIKLIFF